MEQQNRIDQLEAENQELLALMKQAYVKQELEKENIPVEEEWQKFATEHADELNALDSEKPHTATIRKLMGIMPYKVAASIIGILFTAGVTFAAIYSLTPDPSPKERGVDSSSAEKTDSTGNHSPLLGRGVGGEAPVVFDNVVLEKMLPEIAAYYHKEVEFQNDDARSLRFYFVWKQDETLDVVLHRLNLFESVTVELKSDKIVVE